MAKGIVNDCAERSVQMFSEYQGKGTMNEEQRQYLISLIRRERLDLRQSFITTILTNLSTKINSWSLVSSTLAQILFFSQIFRL